ncbi:MAG: 30S ribosome-binding factor RbfA [Dysgonamonadaceae bacterium]|jgi:ribosome-binding factor A|nr:30S ribosome-binding factor RbfA [Dysgonamonadaceae bacterium]MDD3309269.1 30S ribosome-binding factor RbfA [Dysgonamonadaceae bacterium]MDD3901360.1 30S ribosome-binding factor RbfA [Dysgonamonadaceae bacterium]MDD4399325.1 30S ribosome-binding factor RbfA [Dysgonamonadaceae bacterium]MEA5080531.1 30S ribosome-binding factor RbfA [Dysgonamonadaceae bacterium]
MESNRQQKINRLIQKELSEMFLLETKKMQGTLISVTAVRVSPDLGIAHAYLSIFPSEKGNELLQNINENVKEIRYNLGKRVGKQLRVIPELTFHMDDSLDYIENIDRLLNN